MKKKYQLPIIVITTLLVLLSVIGTSYGLYRLTHTEKSYVIFDNDCLEMVADSLYINKPSLDILNEVNGKTSRPYTIAFTNTCNTTKTVELRLNILPESTIKKNEVMVYINGDLKLEPSILSSLISSASSKKEENLFSKILGELEIPAKSTKRINIRTWLDDTRITSEEQNLLANIEVSNNKTIIKPIFKQTILNKYAAVNDPIDFNYIEDETVTLSTMPDENGISYYFRGPVTDNYVLFANLMWQIIRINGDNSIRLIYADNPEYLSSFASKNAESKYLGLTYLEEEVKTNSVMQEYLNNWYQQHLQAYDDYITESTFCNDTSFTTGYGPNYYGAYNRLYTDKAPSLQCPKEQSDYGGVYTTKIGLITADEVVLAGGEYGRTNTNYYLHTGYTFYTSSPSRFANSIAYMSAVNSYGSITELSVTSESYIRPVINLEGLVSVSGSGTYENPYIVDPLEL